MYATCLFCNAALGANEAIEHFPVGRRLAYDSATGRLWVVCKGCARWNLSPLETRWEAIEEAERAFRGTKARVATDNIGLAKLNDGTELVRIGKPPEIEMAVWRYGDQFRKRHRKLLWQSAVASGAFAIPYSIASSMGFAALSAPLAIGVALGSAGPFMQGMITRRYEQWRHRVVPIAAVRDGDQNLLRFTQANVDSAVLMPDGNDAWAITLPYVSVKPAGQLVRIIGGNYETETVHAPQTLHGTAALRALAALLPSANRFGATNKGVESAMHLIQQSQNLDRLLRQASEERVTQDNRSAPEIRDNLVASAPQQVRLALEMALHAEDERRAMEGELHLLEQRWRDADAIAKIADRLLLPEHIQAQLQQLHDDSASKLARQHQRDTSTNHVNAQQSPTPIGPARNTHD
ncbi:MAG: hypothetical protein ABI120_03235 [Gemmatimonadaceae bacterium]